MSPSPTCGTEASGAADLTKKLDKLYEFDREPVAKNRLLRAMYFASAYAGEHVAATEFVIGALFVQWGASVHDIVVGLLLGNLLAVLSWTLICAPIATGTRLTLYWYLHKIGGPMLSFIYNICNALLYCVLAGAMVTVSASAVTLLFGIPDQLEFYPTSVGFVFVVLAVGAVMIAWAIAGFKRFAQFSSVCAPWMILMFVAAALASLPYLGAVSGVGPINSFGAFWKMAGQSVWTGKATVAANQIGFAHVMCFAWICNLAMHLGLSDMAVFRFAKRSWYGLCSATGMFLGHYAAWIGAGILGAAAASMADKPLGQLNSGSVAYTVLGISGALAVMLAGWTTAIPTLYRSGLAFQAVSPNWPRWRVTLAVGSITTVIAAFPFAFTGLMDFLGIYGLVLLPIGAVVASEHWIFPRVGLSRYWAAHRKLLLNWPALVTWIVSIPSGILLLKALDRYHLFFAFIPVWFISILLYTLLASVAGARGKYGADQDVLPQPREYTPEPKKEQGPDKHKPLRLVTGAIAGAALLACLALPIWVWLKGYGDGELYRNNTAFFKKALLIATVIYFVVGTYWRVLRERQNNAKA